MEPLQQLPKLKCYHSSDKKGIGHPLTTFLKEIDNDKRVEEYVLNNISRNIKMENSKCIIIEGELRKYKTMTKEQYVENYFRIMKDFLKDYNEEELERKALSDVCLKGQVSYLYTELNDS